MSNEALWELFPILLSEYDPSWPSAYQAEKSLLVDALDRINVVRISHIGSTAVKGLIAKPTIDILLEIKDDCDVEKLAKAMKKSGYIASAQPDNPPPHLMFLKGYTPKGFVGQAFHVHIRYGGDWPELYFRDYLRLHADVAKQYSALKTKLKNRYEHDRDGYTNAKTDFIEKYTALAKRAFGGRYQPGI